MLNRRIFCFALRERRVALRIRRMGWICIRAVEVDRRRYARFPVLHGDAAVLVQSSQKTHCRARAG